MTLGIFQFLLGSKSHPKLPSPFFRHRGVSIPQTSSDLHRLEAILREQMSAPRSVLLPPSPALAEDRRPPFLEQLVKDPTGRRGTEQTRSHSDAAPNSESSMAKRQESLLKRAAVCEERAAKADDPRKRESFLRAAKVWRDEAERLLSTEENP